MTLDRNSAAQQDEHLVAHLAFATQRFALTEPGFAAGFRDLREILGLERVENTD